jgi:hypothetical protein
MRGGVLPVPDEVSRTGNEHADPRAKPGGRGRRCQTGTHLRLACLRDLRGSVTYVGTIVTGISKEGDGGSALFPSPRPTSPHRVLIATP